MAVTVFDNFFAGIDGVSQVSNLQKRYNRRRKYTVRKEMLVALSLLDRANTFNRTVECSIRDAAYR